MTFQAEFQREVQKLYDYIDGSFATNPKEGKVVRADLERRLSSGHPFLEEVQVRKVGNLEYSGSVRMNMDDMETIVKLEYSFSIPFNKIDRYLDSNAVGIEGKKRLAEKIVHVRVMKESGDEIKGELRDALISYLQGSVPYAIAFLEHQIKKTGKKEGTFRIPRTYID